MSEIIWLTTQDLVRIHDEIVASSGGLPGFRALGAIESMLLRVQNVAHYERVEDVVRLGSMLGYAIVEGHVFNDGNKRTALIATDVFCDLNGVEIFAAPLEFSDQLVGIAAGNIAQERFFNWLITRTHKR